MFNWRLNISYWKIIKRELGSLPQCFLSLLVSFPVFSAPMLLPTSPSYLGFTCLKPAKAHSALLPHSISPRGAFSMLTLSLPRTLHLNLPRGSSPELSSPSLPRMREEDKNPGALRDIMANPRRYTGYNFHFPLMATKQQGHNCGRFSNNLHHDPGSVLHIKSVDMVQCGDNIFYFVDNLAKKWHTLSQPCTSLTNTTKNTK